MKTNRYLYHAMAGLTTLIWGTTMVSTKVLLQEGLSPSQVMFCRFLLGYAFLWALYPRTHRIRSWHDEILFIGMGVTGGSLYFLTENTALAYTQATNVSLVCSLVPLLAAILTCLVFHAKLSRYFWIGSGIALAGIALVVLNGNFVLKLSPIGDLLAFTAICCWAVYCILIKLLHHNYKTLFITRNLFFYGILTLLPYFIYEPFDVPLETLQRPVVWGNLLFLGIIASALCYVMWNMAIQSLGVVTTNIYLYFTPVVTMITAAIVLSEKITGFILLGAGFILAGLWVASRKTWKKTVRL